MSRRTERRVAPERRSRRLVVGIVLGALFVALVAVGVAWTLGAFDARSTPEGSSAAKPDDSLVHYLDRADPATAEPDRILTDSLTGGDSAGGVVAYEGERILDFAVAGDVLAVQLETPDGAHALELVTDGAGTAVELPGAGTIDELRSHGESLGFRFTSAGDALDREHPGTVVLMEIDAPSELAAVVDAEGEPIEAVDWHFIPGSDDVLVLAGDESLLRIDRTGARDSVELGEWAAIDDVASDGSTAIVRDETDTVFLSLDDGSTTPFGPTPIDGEAPFMGQVLLRSEVPQRVQKVGLYDTATSLLTSLVVVDDGETVRTLHEAAVGSGVDDIALAPGGRFVAVEVIPDVAAMTLDGYYPFARATSITTVVIDVDSGDIVAELPGFSAHW